MAFQKAREPKTRCNDKPVKSDGSFVTKYCSHRFLGYTRVSCGGYCTQCWFSKGVRSESLDCKPHRNWGVVCGACGSKCAPHLTEVAAGLKPASGGLSFLLVLWVACLHVCMWVCVSRRVVCMPRGVLGCELRCCSGRVGLLMGWWSAGALHNPPPVANGL